jgi:hypothetical protein
MSSSSASASAAAALRATSHRRGGPLLPPTQTAIKPKAKHPSTATRRRSPRIKKKVEHVVTEFNDVMVRMDKEVKRFRAGSSGVSATPPDPVSVAPSKPGKVNMNISGVECSISGMTVAVGHLVHIGQVLYTMEADASIKPSKLAMTCTARGLFCTLAPQPNSESYTHIATDLTKPIIVNGRRYFPDSHPDFPPDVTVYQPKLTTEIQPSAP